MGRLCLKEKKGQQNKSNHHIQTSFPQLPPHHTHTGVTGLSAEREQSLLIPKRQDKNGGKKSFLSHAVTRESPVLRF